jgi:hypothetical protein
MKLIAKDGFFYTNGSSIVRTVVLPDGADPSVWQEITEAEAQEIIARIEAEEDV